MRITFIGLMAFAGLMSWALVSPVGSSPDDDFHLTSIWCAQGERDYLCESITSESVSVPDSVVNAPCFAYNRDITASCQADLSSELVQTERANTVEHSYPPGFYWVMSWLVSYDVGLSVSLMRAMNVTIFLLLFGLVYGLIERRLRTPLVVAVAVTIFPLGAFVIASTNPSSWTLYAPVFMFLAARSLLQADASQRRRWLLLAVLLIAGMSAAARSDSPLFVLFAALLAGVIDWNAARTKGAFAIALGISAIAVIASTLTGSQLTAASSGLDGAPDGANHLSFGLFLRNIADLPSAMFGSLGTGGLGWLDTPMPSIVWAPQFLALGALAVTACAFSTHRNLFAPAISLVALAGVPFAIAMASAAPIGAYVQPRYVFPLLALTVIAVLTSSHDRVFLSRTQVGFTLATAVFANGTALAAVLVRYQLGTDVTALTAAFPNLPGYAIAVLMSIACTIGLSFAAYRAVKSNELV